MKLLVVDDEKVVQNSIRLIIKKENLKFVDMETASTGKEAIEKTISYRPDAIFMDINMPGLNGIETMKSIIRLHPTVLFVIISAYDVFEYAKESLRAGAYDYIVKPFVPKRIVETLIGLNEKISLRKAEREETLHLRERAAKLSSFANDGLLSLMIYSSDVQALSKKYPELFPQKRGRIAILKFKDDAVTHAEAALFEIRRSFADHIIGSIVSDRFIMYIPEGSDIDAINKKLKKNLGADGYLFACGSEEDITELYSSYRTALSIINNTQSFDGLLFSSAEKNISDISSICSKLISCDPQMIPVVAEELYLAVSSQNEPDKVRQAMSAALLGAAHSMLSGEALNENLFQMIPENIENILSARTEQDIIRESVSFMTEIGKSAALKTGNKHIRAALDYIDANYREDISLESAAKHICVAPGSLSRLFRMHLEKSFTELLIEKRIAKACALIKEEEYSIKEICYMVGYNDPNYFSRVFKKTTGLSPSDYREYGT